ncbi:MAG: flagellar biosynthetic protein FliO [Steroidobacterales bacterium]
MNDKAASGPARGACRIALSAMLLMGVRGLAWASANAPFAAPVASSVAGPAAGTVRVTVAMVLVLAAVLAAAWLLRRLRSISGSPAGALEVLAQVSLGTRERAVLIRIGDRQLLLGVAPGNVRTLHVLETAVSGAFNGVQPAVAADGPDTAARPSFKSLLLKSLGK